MTKEGAASVRSRWSDEEAASFVARYGGEWGEPLALRVYSSRLLGADPALVLHGGGNTSVKTPCTNILGERIPAIFVKASGVDMASIEPVDFPGLDLEYLRRLRKLRALDDATMAIELSTHQLFAHGRSPSIEALVHAFLSPLFIDHTHADAVLALTNRPEGQALVRRALGDDVIVLPYITPGFWLALAAAEAMEARPTARGMVWAHHGVLTWGDSAQESYGAMIALVSEAERFLEGGRRALAAPATAAAADDRAGAARVAHVATTLRGLLAQPTGDCDRPYRRVVLQSLTSPEVLAALAAPQARETLVSPPLTTDHLIRTKPLPLWIEGLIYDDPEALGERLASAVQGYREQYEAYLERHRASLPAGVEAFDPLPRVVLIPGLGAFFAGPDLRESTIVRDITEHTLAVKTIVAATGSYEGLPEVELFHMEYRTLQHAKLGPRAVPGGWRAEPSGPGARRSASELALRGEVALITGAAGAIGTGICEGLLRAGCLVVATDLPGAPLESLTARLGPEFPGRVLPAPLDVTEPESVADAFAVAARTWGGVDLVVANAGIAAVSPLTHLDLERYRTLERVNVEGTLLVLAEAGRMFKRQGTGGDIVLVSTKNVFSPGADFGAYSSTKAAAHQLARIASLEFAGDDVRVNMVAPDAVFSHGSCRSGLWAEVGPGRMRARGLDEEGLEAYYQSRNLLKARVTADHVANAVLFFATRQTPTTGATIPVDGGLPDSTPR